LLLLSPFAPHITEELWHQIGRSDSIHLQGWPEWDNAALKAEELTIVVQVDGRLRDRLKVPVESTDKEVEQLALQSSKVQAQLEDKQIAKVIKRAWQIGQHCYSEISAESKITIFFRVYLEW